MQKVRVYQLAKELAVPSALILELLDRMGQDVKSDLNVLEPGVADQVRKRVSRALAAEKKRLAAEQAEREATERRAVTARRHPAAEAAEASPAPPAEETPAPAAAPVETPAAAAEEEGPATDTPTQPETPTEEAPAAAAAAPAAPTAAGDEPEAEAPKAPAEGPRPAARPVVKIPEVRAPEVKAPEVKAPAAGGPGAERPTAAAGPRLPGQTRAPRVFPAKRMPTLSSLKPQPRKPPGRGARPNEMPAAAIRPGGPMPPPFVPARGPGAGKKRRKKKGKKDPREAAAAQIVSRPKPDLPPVPEKITLSEGVTVKELAEKLNRKSKDVIARLLVRGVMATINQPLDPKIAIGVAEDFGSTANVLTFEEEATLDATAAAAAAPADGEVDADAPTDSPDDLQPRPPVITVMGHVDHGKTSLLDAIRAANVVDREAGGITQHIGAYRVEKNGRSITFLDTPGHEAFTLMRARGAKVTDIVILVVAADDGVKPQTKEAIDHAKAAGVPIVIAINKVDKPDANPDRVKQQLTEHDLIVEEYGGKIVACEVSAKKRTGIDELLELILLEADLRELKANPDRLAGGVVLEARRDRARGVLATVLVQGGTLRIGDPFIAGAAHGKVRAMTDDHGRRVEEAGPSTPVEIMGFADEPAAGDSLQAIADESKARQIASFRQEKERAARQEKASARRSLERFARDIAKGEVKELPILLKADVQGSIEALQKSLGDLPTDKVRVNVIRASIGAISQADVLLAAASNAIVVGFNVRPDKAAQDAARVEGVDIRNYAVIYDLLDEIKQAMVGLLEPTFKEVVLGQAEVRALFKVPKAGVIAGCYVTEGKVTRNAEVRLLRDNVVIHTGKVSSLRRFKDDASEVKSGYECGIGIANYNDLKEGDVIEFFVMEKVAAESL